MIKEELRQRMHQSIPVQGRWLRRVVGGYFNYHAVPAQHACPWTRSGTMSPTSGGARYGVAVGEDRMTWERVVQLVDAWLPKPSILHPWPSDRFAVTHPRWEPHAGKSHVRFCAGGA